MLEIIVLIGADYLWQFQKRCIIRGKVEEPVAVETELGWVLSGPMKCKYAEFVGRFSTVQANLIVQYYLSSQIVMERVKELWYLETLERGIHCQLRCPGK